jgi:hypothetical protein
MKQKVRQILGQVPNGGHKTPNFDTSSKFYDRLAAHFTEYGRFYPNFETAQRKKEGDVGGIQIRKGEIKEKRLAFRTSSSSSTSSAAAAAVAASCRRALGA